MARARKWTVGQAARMEKPRTTDDSKSEKVAS